jgi:cytoskeleton-associated protein 5
MAEGGGAPQEDYSSLPLSERLVHKVWKVRLGAYEQLEKIWKQAEDGADRSFREHGRRLFPLFFFFFFLFISLLLFSFSTFISFYPASTTSQTHLFWFLCQAGVLSKIIADNNVAAQDKGLDAFLVYVDRANDAPK